MKYINWKICAFGIFLMSQNVFALATTQEQFIPANKAQDYSNEVPGTEGMDEMQVVSALKHDIQLLDEEIMKCERKRKGWVAATVVGGVGAVGTGVAALVQHNKIQDKKDELNKIQNDINSAKGKSSEQK